MNFLQYNRFLVWKRKGKVKVFSVCTFRFRDGRQEDSTGGASALRGFRFRAWRCCSALPTDWPHPPGSSFGRIFASDIWQPPLCFAAAESFAAFPLRLRPLIVTTVAVSPWKVTKYFTELKWQAFRRMDCLKLKQLNRCESIFKDFLCRCLLWDIQYGKVKLSFTLNLLHCCC